MKTHLILSLAILSLLGACSAPKPIPRYTITNVIPAGSRVEYFAQEPDNTWKQVMKFNTLPQPMRMREAEKWALSAAQQCLGKHWKDYCIRVTPPEGVPVVVWKCKASPTI